MMYILYYFLTNVATGEKKIEVTDVFAGDVGDHIFIRGQEYIIDDYAEEWSELEIPEDFNY